MFSLRALLLVLVVGARGLFGATQDLIIFDEDDPLGIAYYDASIGQVSGNSSLRLLAKSRDKMPVTTNSAALGRYSGVLEWTSREGGQWAMHVFRPGFHVLDVRRYEGLTFALNGPREIAAQHLPSLGLQDGRGQTKTLPLEPFVPRGIDSDTNTWQRVDVPLAVFPFEAEFDSARVKHVTFRQGAADGDPHVLWIDDLRLQSDDHLVSTNPPAAPKNLVGRAGDRSITLHWDAVPGATVRGYRVFRGDNAGSFHELPGSPVQIQSIADVQVENGQKYTYHVKAENEAGLGVSSEALTLVPRPFPSDAAFLEYLQATAFDYFWYEANPLNGMIRDRTQPWSAASIAAIGFGLTAIGIGIDHRWITRDEGRVRVLRTLHTLWRTPQGAAAGGTSGHKGWFYHFLNMEDATRFGSSELSSIDTALLLAGVLYVREFFDSGHSTDQQIRNLADTIFNRIDWEWMLNRGETLAMGWHPEHGFTKARWEGYNEASILYLLGLGATNRQRLEPAHWKAWTRTYSWRTSYGHSFIHFPPLFGHQYSACWVDFRNIADDFTRSKGITYFENSRRATLAQREYCIANPGDFPGYGPNVWGLTACDGPGTHETHSYMARGAPPAENDDGTLAPTGPGGSLPFAQQECVRALRTLYDTYRERIWSGYGFRDAFNLKEDWFGADVIGIDQGPILIMAENLRTGRAWKVMSKNAVLKRGLKQAGFRTFSAETLREK
jgi:hypothetical protein